ncbi:MAG: pyruvate formate lyase family protein [bacterium]
MSATDVKEITRTQRLKQKILDAPYAICIERARYVTEAHRRTRGMHPSVRAARAFENTLRKMTIYILDEEIFAGNTTSRLVGTLLPVERGEMNIVMEVDLDQLQKRKKRPYEIDPKDKKELLNEIIPYWKGKTVRDGKHRLWKREGLIVKPSLSPKSILERIESFGAKQLNKSVLKYVKGREKYLLKAMYEIPLNNPGLVNNVFDDQGHQIIGNKNVIGIGFKGVRDRAAEKLKAPLPRGKQKFLESVIQCCEAAKMFAGRYAILARDMAEDETDPIRRGELLAIARHAERVPWLPPRTFHEAVQFLWLTQVMATVSTGMGGICALGRPDQYLYPYYLKDVEDGTIEYDSALELLEELLVKLANNLICLPSFAKDTASEFGADSMAPTIGGLGPDGEDATNELSSFFLDAIVNMDGISNSYSVRVSGKTKPEFFEKISEVHTVTSGVAIFNDDIVVPALEKTGCAPEHARDYGIIGCVEPSPQGNTFACTSGNDISLVGILEMTLNNGKIRMMGRRMGLKTGDPARFTSFEQLTDAYKKQMRHMVNYIARCVNEKDKVYMNGFHNPFISATLEGCVENAEDMTQGGALYNFASISGRGLGTTADSLAAIKKFVFDERRVTMRELLDTLRTNWKGRESLRNLLETRSPRYGADDDEADAIARDIAGTFCDEVMRRRSVRKGGMFRPGFFSYGMHVIDGSILGATPDGRRAGQPVSNSLSPTNGAEIKGPTAALRSAAKIDHTKISNGSSLNMKLLPTMLKTEEGRRKFEAMIKGYFALGGMHVQFNIVDNKTLRDAQRHPERYRDLVVRVSGYSAYFTDLGRPIQDDIIRRTEFAGC